MNKEMKKVLFAVTRVFVDAASKGNDHTMHKSEIHAAVCRTLRRRKEREKRNLASPVDAAITKLKQHRVLFETIDDWGPDKLQIRKFKPADSKRAFGMTPTAVDYLTRGDILAGYSIKGELVISELLRHFGVIETEPQPVIVSPAAIVETVAAIKETATVAEDANPEQTETAQTPTVTTMSTIDNNAKRIAAEIKNLNWPNEQSPKNLLGALRQANAFSPDTRVAGSAIQWESHDMKRARKILEDRQLVLKHGSPQAAETGYHRGIYLTALGKAVAEAGDFTDDRPAGTRFIYVPVHKREGAILKGGKKPAETSGQLCYLLPNGDRVLVNTKEELHAIMSLRMSGAEAAAISEQFETQPVEPEPAEPKMLSVEETISRFVRPAANRVCEAIQYLAVATGSDGERAEVINNDGLYHAITVLQDILIGIKHGVSRAMTDDKPFDPTRLTDYAAQVELDMEQLVQGDSERKVSLFDAGATDRNAKIPMRRRLPSLKRVAWEQ